MTLTAKKVVNLTGTSEFNGVVAQRYSGTIDPENSSTTSINAYMGDQATYDTNRADVRKDFAAFQEAVWAEEDRLINEAAATTEETTATETPAESEGE